MIGFIVLATVEAYKHTDIRNSCVNVMGTIERNRPQRFVVRNCLQYTLVSFDSSEASKMLSTTVVTVN